MALARCPRCERVVDAEYRPIRELTEADLKRTVAIALCTECKSELELTPGEQLLNGGYRQCLRCGRLMLRDGTPSRRMTKLERDTFSPCVGLDWVCVECTAQKVRWVNDWAAVPPTECPECGAKTQWQTSPVQLLVCSSWECGWGVRWPPLKSEPRTGA
jgi:DNA-directed RNA polymerase subunit RPC12/RpoP